MRKIVLAAAGLAAGMTLAAAAPAAAKVMVPCTFPHIFFWVAPTASTAGGGTNNSGAYVTVVDGDVGIVPGDGIDDTPPPDDKGGGR